MRRIWRSLLRRDGGHFGGYIKPRNLADNRVDRRHAKNQNGKRKVVVIVREGNGNSVPAVFHSEGAAQAWIKARIAKGTTVHADEASSWDGLHGAFEMKRINHQEACSFDSACTNAAEEYFSRRVAPRLAIITKSRANIFRATLRSPRGLRIIAACQMAIKQCASRVWLCARPRLQIL